jgi:hypothetical protein
MKTYKQLKEFCETKKVRYEVNPMYSKPYEYLAYEDGKVVWKESRTLLGFEFGMCNIAGRKGQSEWQWVWFETILCPKELEDDTTFFFRNRYSQVTGQDHKGWREGINAENTIEARMRNV